MNFMTNNVNFLDEISNFIFTSKYARFNALAERRETWEECVERVATMHYSKFRKKLSKEDLDEVKWAFEMVKEKWTVPSMRSMQFAGKAITASNARIYNCAVRHIDSIRSFAEVFYLLLCGCGVGIGLNKQFIGRLPNLVDANDKTGTVLTYVVEDSIEGWSDSFEALLNCYFKNTAYTGRKIVFDYSKIRPEGAPLKTSGGKAPGYKGLKACHKKIKGLLDRVIEDSQQVKLKTINAYDILMHISDAVLSGGIRRSATSVIFEPDDVDMMEAKTYFTVSKFTKFTLDEDTQKYSGKVTVDKRAYEIEIAAKDYDYEYKQLVEKKQISWRYIEPQRARSNNSVLLLRNKATLEQFKAVIERTRQFGEPGFVFGNDPRQLFNPCQPAWAPVLTEAGIKQLKDVSVGDKIWSEAGWTTVINKWSTGVKKVCKYQTTAGTFYGTENHKLVSNGVKTEAKDCEVIDILAGWCNASLELDPNDIMDGLVMGDGSVHKASNDLVYLCVGQNDQDYFKSEISGLFAAKRDGIKPGAYEVITSIQAEELPLTFNRSIPSRFIYGSPAKVAGFLRGLYTANGSVCGNRITLKAASKPVIEQAQLMLSSLGIRSYFTTNKPSLVKFNNGEYLCKQSYDLNISSDCKKFQSIIGFIQGYKNEKVEQLHKIARPTGRTSFDVKSVTVLGEEEVFDITVDNSAHTYWTGGLNVSNCFEISFIPVTADGVCGVQFCNLSSINGAQIKTVEDFRKAVKAATIIGTLQASYTEDMTYLSNAAKILTETEALLGVSMTGVMDNPTILLTPEIQLETAKYAVEINELWAKKIGINPAARVTCLKPEGTTSLVLRSASGIHPHHAHKYFRRVQCNKVDPVYKFFKTQNPHMCEPGVWSSNKTDDVITFPLTVPPSATVKADLTALKHLEIIKSTQQNWVLGGLSEHNTKPISHNVSCTVIVKDDEWEAVITYLFDNREHFSAVSLLPFIGDKLYKQAPLEAVSTPGDEEAWEKLISAYRPVNYRKLKEDEDSTKVQETASCAGGACELF